MAEVIAPPVVVESERPSSFLGGGETGKAEILRRVEEFRKKQEQDTLDSSRLRQDALLSNLGTLMEEHGTEVVRMLQHETELQQQEMQRIAEEPMFAGSMEEQDKIIKELQSAQQEQNDIMNTIIDKTTSESIQKLQNLAEKDLLRASWKRQDGILKQIAAKRQAARAARAAKVAASKEAEKRRIESSAKDIEFKIRSIEKRERLAGTMSYRASQSGDEAAWKRTSAILDKLADEKAGLYEDLRKIDPKFADQLEEDLRSKWWNR